MADAFIDMIILSILSGLATGLGGLVVVIRKPGERLLGFLMGLAAGIMVALSFLELLAQSLKISSLFIATLGFVAGSLSMFVLDFVLPHRFFSVKENGLIEGRLQQAGMLLAVGISLHNLPEGAAIALGYAYLPRLGLIIAVAMAMHNIPEGIAVALPLYASGTSRFKAFRIALISGLVEPLGAFFASVVLAGFVDIVPLGLAFAGGVMVFVTLDELIPVAHKHGHEHFTSLGVIMGCILTFILLAALQ